MKIEINDCFKSAVNKIAHATKVTPDIVVESAFILTVAISRLPQEKQELIQQWVNDPLKTSCH